MNERTDKQLVASFQQGEDRAYELLVIKYTSRVRAIVANFLKYDHDSIEDVVQDTFIKAYQALKRFRGDSQFYTWLYRIAVNTAKNHLSSAYSRQKMRNISLDDEDNTSDIEIAEANHQNPEEKVAINELDQHLQKLLNQLPNDLRNAFCLREFSGMNYDQIAATMNCPVGTIRSRIFRARAILREKLNEYYGK